jgi:Fic family protein
MTVDPRLLHRITDKFTRLQAARPLPPAAVRKLDEQLALEWTYNSNAIEGNTLTLRETQLILETGLTIGGKTLREHAEVINHQQAIAYVTSLATRSEVPISIVEVRRLHALVLKGIDDGEAGKWRTIPVRIAGARFVPPEPFDVPHRMQAWSAWLRGEAMALHPVERSALAHHRLAAIHPFVDGNGRTARLVMNLLLLRDGYLPTVIQKTQRKQYYRALAQADAGQVEPFVNFVARGLERSLALYLSAVTPRRSRNADEDWISLSEAAAGTRFSQEYLSLLARTGRLEAVKHGRNWVTTRRAVRDYEESVRYTVSTHAAPRRSHHTTRHVSTFRTPTAPAMPVVTQLPSDCTSGLSTKAIRSKRPVTACTCLITEPSNSMPGNSLIRSCTRVGSASINT